VGSHIIHVKSFNLGLYSIVCGHMDKSHAVCNIHHNKCFKSQKTFK
jgi:hypothetical protein